MKHNLAWKITYKNGLMNTTEVYAKTEEEAKKLGLAEYRRNYGSFNLVSNVPLEDVVASATCLDPIPAAGEESQLDASSAL